MIEVGEDKGMQQPRENKQKTRDERIALLMQHLIHHSAPGLSVVPFQFSYDPWGEKDH